MEPSLSVQFCFTVVSPRTPSHQRMGPGVIILLRAPLTKQQIDDLEAWLRMNTSQLQGAQLQWEFMMDGSTFDIYQDETLGGPRSFGLSEEETQMEGSEMEQVPPELGYTPQRELVLYAMAKGRLYHLILGNLALVMAERYDAVIDMGGSITGKRRQDWDPRLNKIPGKVFEVTDSPIFGDGCYHLVDTTFMCGWLKDPDFHLIK